HVGMFETLPSNPNAFQAAKPLRVTDPLCSARKTLAAFCLSLPARNERGESRREGKLTKSASSPRPSPPFVRRRGRENVAARSKQIFSRTELVTDPRSALRGVALAGCIKMRPPLNTLNSCLPEVSAVHVTLPLFRFRAVNFFVSATMACSV